MCGRFALFAMPEVLAEYFALADPPQLAPHYNLTPGQDIAAVRIDRSGARRLHALRWGLVPFWAKDAVIGRRLINARLDSLADQTRVSGSAVAAPLLDCRERLLRVAAARERQEAAVLRARAGRAAARVRGSVGALARRRHGTAARDLRDRDDGRERHARADPRPNARDADARGARRLARSNEHGRDDCRARGTRPRGRGVGRRDGGQRSAQRRRARSGAGCRNSTNERAALRADPCDDRAGPASYCGASRKRWPR